MSGLSELTIEKAFIGGHWRGAEQRFAVTNPATGEVLAEVADLDAEAARDAVAAADAAWPAWRRQTAKERANLLRAWFNLIMENQEALARLMTLEQGKPLAESRGEVAYGASFVEYYAEEAKRVAKRKEREAHRKTQKQQKGGTRKIAAVVPWQAQLGEVGNSR
jgi:succinate-semialdehyde dehydrogenase/glutarate-semialdehyde dehydrogenase